MAATPSVRVAVAAVLGAAVAVATAVVAWNVRGPACDSSSTGGKLLQPSCVSPGTPTWMLAAAVVAGALVGLAVVRQRKRPSGFRRALSRSG